MSIVRRTKIWLILVLGFALIMAASITWWQLRSPSNPIPQNIAKSVDFTLFYPGKLPASYNIDKSSFQANSGPVVTYNAKDTQGHHIIFSIQPRPETFNYEAFYNQGLSGTSKIPTDAGEAAIGTANNKLMGSLVSDKSWVIITSDTSNVTRSDLQTILKNLRANQ